jgi:hypothetical protein
MVNPAVRLSSLCCILFLCWPVLAPANPREPVAVLYAHDGKALYRIDPNDGEFFKIGDLPQAVDPSWEELALHYGFSLDGTFVTNQGGTPLSYSSMVWDHPTASLYVVMGSSTPNGMGGFSTLLGIAALDPKTVTLKPVWLATEAAGNVAITYDPIDKRLYRYFVAYQEGSDLESFDPATGRFGEVKRLTVRPPTGAVFFDPRGHIWDYLGEDGYYELREYTAQGTELSYLEMSVPFQGGNPALGASYWKPGYFSFSFQPFAGQLFALAIPLRPFVEPGLGYSVDLQHFILCTINLQTGEPQKVIATYDRANDPNWSLTIAWGLEP